MLQEVLADLKLPPEAVELPVPRYFIADRQKARCPERLRGWARTCKAQV